MMQTYQYRVVQQDIDTFIVQRLHKPWICKAKWRGHRQWYYFANDDGGWWQPIRFKSIENATKFMTLIQSNKLHVKRCLFDMDIVYGHRQIGQSFITTIDWNHKMQTLK